MRTMAIFPFTICLSVFFGFSAVHGQDDPGIWREFVAAVKNDQITTDQIRPDEGVSQEGLMEQLRNFREMADRDSSWGEWEAAPDIFPIENQVHFLISLGFGDTTKTGYCFTFLKDKGRWYYRHVECIFIRLDQTPSPPTTEFPDLPEQKKAWQREEVYWSQIIYFYSTLAKEKGKEYFLNLLKDGAGYYLGAKSWVPFVPPQRAFILYLCWEQSRLRENSVLLKKLTEQEAMIELQTHYFYLYKMTGHLKQQISFEDYRRIFETIWQDRATRAGWNLEITCEDPECLKCAFRFTRTK